MGDAGYTGWSTGVGAVHLEIRSGPLINIDQTTVQNLAEPGRTLSSKSYIWIVRGGAPGKPSVRYHYAPNRAEDVNKASLQDYSGVVQTDGYRGYHCLDLQPGVRHASSIAHLRRKVDGAGKYRGKGVTKDSSIVDSMDNPAE